MRVSGRFIELGEHRQKLGTGIFSSQDNLQLPMFDGHTLAQQRAANYPQLESTGRTRKHFLLHKRLHYAARMKPPRRQPSAAHTVVMAGSPTSWRLFSFLPNLGEMDIASFARNRTAAAMVPATFSRSSPSDSARERCSLILRFDSPDTAAVSAANATFPRPPKVGGFRPLSGCSASHISLRRLIATARCAVTCALVMPGMPARKAVMAGSPTSLSLDPPRPV